MICSRARIRLCTPINMYKTVNVMFVVSRCCTVMLMVQAEWIHRIRRQFLKSGLVNIHTRASLVMQKLSQWYCVFFLRGYRNGDHLPWCARKFRFSQLVALGLNSSISTFCGLKKTRVQYLKHDSLIIEDKAKVNCFCSLSSFHSVWSWIYPSWPK
jgi:hypothetical protein